MERARNRKLRAHAERTSVCRWGTQVSAVPDAAEARALLLSAVPRATEFWNKRATAAGAAATKSDARVQREQLGAPPEPSADELRSAGRDAARSTGVPWETAAALALAGSRVALLSLSPAGRGCTPRSVRSSPCGVALRPASCMALPAGVEAQITAAGILHD